MDADWLGGGLPCQRCHKVRLDGDACRYDNSKSEVITSLLGRAEFIAMLYI